MPRDDSSVLITEDWPTPRYGDPVWVTVSEYDLGYLRRVLEKEGPLRAQRLAHWAMEAVVGRGITKERDALACEFLSAAAVTLGRSSEGRNTAAPGGPVFQGDGEVAPATLAQILANNLPEDGPANILPNEIRALVTADIGDEVTVGGGAFATTTFTRIG